MAGTIYVTGGAGCIGGAVVRCRMAGSTGAAVATDSAPGRAG